MYEIIDNKGVLFSGDEEGMLHIFDVLTNPDNFPDIEVQKFECERFGDLKFVKVIKRSK